MPEPKPEPKPEPETSKSLEFATYNAFFLPGFDRTLPTEIRRETTTAGIVDIDADVLCL